LEKRGLSITRQQGIPVVYEEVRIHAGFFADMVVEDQVIVEIKAVETVAPVHKKQLLTYLKLADKHLGLLINFNVVPIKTASLASSTGLKNDLSQSRQGRQVNALTRCSAARRATF
jgi:GxxExxY protein